MNLAEFKTEIAAHKGYKDLTDQQWNVKSTYRGLHKRSKKDFDWLEKLYPKKISELRDRLAGDWDFSVNISRDGKELNSQAEIYDAISASMDEWYYCQEKERRLLDKLACVIEEQRLRKNGFVIRAGTHDAADYYIDYVNGSDANNGLTTGAAYKTITKYTTTEVRVPGDRAFLRANITWLQGTEAVDITFDENGSVELYIEIIGCDSVTNDPWSDSSNVKPIIDFENAAYQLKLTSDHYWGFTRLDFRQSNDTSGTVFVSTSDYYNFLNCNFQDNNSSSVEGININLSEFGTINTCTFENCFGAAINVTNSNTYIKSITITAGGDVGTGIGLRVDNGACVWVQDSAFVGVFGTIDINVSQNSQLIMRNVTRADSAPTVVESAVVFSEDDDGTYKSQITTFGHGTITRGTTSPRAGGADSFVIMESNSLCGPNRPLRLGDRLAGFARVWKTAGSYTATVYARVDSAWDSALTAAQCYMVTSELDNAGDASRIERQSTETINNATSWTAFTTAVTPAREGWVYFWFYLAEFEDATEKVDVDIKVDVS